MPTDRALTDDEACRITAEELAADYDLVPGDGADDSAGLQGAIDRIRHVCRSTTSAATEPSPSR